ncbi:hypothetical protein JCM11641_005181 [Rhodosporidiobolus odoratus]
MTTRPPPQVEVHAYDGEDARGKGSSYSDTVKVAALALGVVFGDLGTSSLYAMNGIFPAAGPAPDREDVIGAVSCIIWTILLVVVLKYCIVALEFGTSHGEGGPFAVYTTIFPPREPKGDGFSAITTYAEATSPPSSHKSTRILQKPVVKFSLFVLVVLGVSLTIADGMLTPAVSVTSAVAGIAVAAPAVSHSVVGISCAILVVLFLVQPWGTKKIGLAFSPILFVWFSVNAIGGAISIAKYPGIFRAFDPSRAVVLFIRTGDYDLLNGVVLAITGVEALFANLGQFSKGGIRLAFLGLAAPCLILQYLGQGAALIDNPETVISNVFFQSIPGGVGKPFWWFTWIFAILSAIIASQALITATFSLVQQLTSLNVMPPLRIVHTDDDSQGRIYVPAANFLLFVGTIGLTCGFGTDVGLTAAYGFAVAGVLLVTTLMISLAIVQIKHLPVALAVVWFILSGFIDGLFFGATSKKVPHGAWFPLSLACFLLISLLLWSWAKGLENKFDSLHRYRLSEVLRRATNEDDLRQEEEDAKKGGAASSEEDITEIEGGNAVVMRKRPKLPTYEIAGGGVSIARPPVFALFHNHSSFSSDGAPHAFTAFLRSYPALPAIIVFLTVRTVGVPHVSLEDRFLADRLPRYQGVYTAVARFGYRDVLDLSDIGLLRTRIVALETRSAENAEDLRERVERVDGAVKGAVTHILPNFHVSADPSEHRPKVIRLVRKFLLEEVYRRIAVNFDSYDQLRFGSEEDVLRMGVAAVL